MAEAGESLLRDAEVLCYGPRVDEPRAYGMIRRAAALGNAAAFARCVLLGLRLTSDGETAPPPGPHSFRDTGGLWGPLTGVVDEARAFRQFREIARHGDYDWEEGETSPVGGTPSEVSVSGGGLPFRPDSYTVTSALFFTGRCLDFGDGAKMDRKLSVHWYTLAVRRGHVAAQNNLGCSYRDGDGVEVDFKEAMRLFSLSAEKNNTQAINNLACCYRDGAGVEPDFEQAAELFRRSAELGHSSAQCCLGWAYDCGNGVAKDPKEAVRWYLLAAAPKPGHAGDKGHAQAQNNLGCSFRDAEGVDLDLGEAARWFKMAADQGHSSAQNSLGCLYESGLGVKQSREMAIELYRKGADQGNSQAQSNLAVCYRDGTGVEQSFEEAATWFSKAAADGLPSACKELARYYAEGRGVERNVDRAFELFSTAQKREESEGVAVELDALVVTNREAIFAASAAELVTLLEKGASLALARASENESGSGLALFDNCLHAAVRSGNYTNACLFFAQPEFDALVLEQNIDGKRPADLCPAEETALRDLVSCTRKYRAALFMFCWEESKTRPLGRLPGEVVRLICEEVLPSTARSLHVSEAFLRFRFGT
jgi:TPR repeat protein